MLLYLQKNGFTNKLRVKISNEEIKYNLEVNVNNLSFLISVVLRVNILQYSYCFL
ncbi:Uncharacterised protein [Chryseobacterium indoltheticum]|uniref:Uncharacterized protein n=1 Tax=Chryseobacterium indoltheticum TaxID=254 RepID=A0A381FH35_9FLAO|nr:Uncharacterised protein [Chryseobacterium indoltheticum]